MTETKKAAVRNSPLPHRSLFSYDPKSLSRVGVLKYEKKKTKKMGEELKDINYRQPNKLTSVNLFLLYIRCSNSSNKL